MQRHDLLRIRHDDWARVLGARTAATDLPDDARHLVATWAERRWPVVVRRRAPGEHPDRLPVALPLPPFCGKLRLAFVLPDGIDAAPVPPVSLSDTLDTAPAAWRPQIRALIAVGDRLALRPSVFGALLWEHVTGLAYVRPGSDLDLLWPKPSARSVPDLLDGLRRLDAVGPTRLDGEIRLADGVDVNWRELDRELPRHGTVLIKAMDGIDMRCAHTLFD